MAFDQSRFTELFGLELDKLGVSHGAHVTARISAQCFSAGSNGSHVAGMVLRAMSKWCGQFNGELVGAALASGKLSVADVINGTFPEQPEPRDVVRAQFMRVVAKTVEDSAKAAQWAIALEEGVYQATIHRCMRCETEVIRSWESPRFVSIYSERAHTVALATDPDSSTGRQYGIEVLHMLLRGEITAAELTSRTAAELTPAAFAAEREEIAEREKQVLRERTSQLYPCPNCKAKNCTYRSVQTRSLDEPATIFCKCKNCGHRYHG